MNDGLKRGVTPPRRPLGRTGLEVSILGFGCMRLPGEQPSGRATDAFDPAKRVDAASACLACGECGPKCPQRIAIAERLAEAHARLGATPGTEKGNSP